jgi:hypothetical protein
MGNPYEYNDISTIKKAFLRARFMDLVIAATWSIPPKDYTVFSLGTSCAPSQYLIVPVASNKNTSCLNVDIRDSIYYQSFITSFSFTGTPPLFLLSSAACMNAYISSVSASSTGGFLVVKNSLIFTQISS